MIVAKSKRKKNRERFGCCRLSLKSCKTRFAALRIGLLTETLRSFECRVTFCSDVKPEYDKKQAMK